MTEAQGDAPDEVRYSKTSDGVPFAYLAGQIITTELHRALQVLDEIHEGSELQYQQLDQEDAEEHDDLENEPPTSAGRKDPTWNERPATPRDSTGAPIFPTPDGLFFLVRGVSDPLRAVIELRARGILAQPNFVYFAHPLPAPLTASPAYANPAYANPAYANPAYANPAYANPAYANPAYANPAYANPAYANPAYANPAYANPASVTDAVVNKSSAVPAVWGKTTGAIETAIATAPGQGPKDGVRIFVLDTGLVDRVPALGKVLKDCPRSGHYDRQTLPTNRPSPARVIWRLPPATGPSSPPSLSKSCRIQGAVGKVLENSGIGDEWTIARRIRALTTGLSRRHDRERSVLNLSFGATVLDHPFLMAHVVSAIQSIGVLVVASAGNDAISQPVFPAALPGVIGVGALGPAGPAPFTNYGPWVTACAPGLDLVSGFFCGTRQDANASSFGSGRYGAVPRSQHRLWPERWPPS